MVVEAEYPGVLPLVLVHYPQRRHLYPAKTTYLNATFWASAAFLKYRMEWRAPRFNSLGSSTYNERSCSVMSIVNCVHTKTGTVNSVWLQLQYIQLQ